MLYILNTIFPKKRNFKNSITALYGIGRIRALKLASILGLHPFARIEQVDQRQLNNLGRLIEKSFLIDFELKRKISLNILALRKLATLRGFCHTNGLPSRGQRTHTNASTANRLSKKMASVLQNQGSSSSSFSSSRFNNKRNKKINDKGKKKTKK